VEKPLYSASPRGGKPLPVLPRVHVITTGGVVPIGGTEPVVKVHDAGKPQSAGSWGLRLTSAG
jgi:hypothetical protein